MIQTNMWIHIKKIFLEKQLVTKETDLDCESPVSQERFPWESDSSWAVSRQTGTGEGSSSNCRNAKCHSTLEATCAFCWKRAGVTAAQSPKRTVITDAVEKGYEMQFRLWCLIQKLILNRQVMWSGLCFETIILNVLGSSKMVSQAEKENSG
jgi:hypothetical protein